MNAERPIIDQKTINEINAAGNIVEAFDETASREFEETGSRLTNIAFMREGQMEALGLTEEDRNAARNQLLEMGLDPKEVDEVNSRRDLDNPLDGALAFRHMDTKRKERLAANSEVSEHE